jgi:5-methylcytosine-specific restriction endonuclease McrA
MPTETLLEALRRFNVFNLGHVDPNFDRNVWRRDDFGNLIRRSDYGDRSSPYGWEIDHIHPRALFGSDDLSNLRPLHCRANATLGGMLGSMLGATKGGAADR